MTYLFVSWLDDHTIVVSDSDLREIWRGDWHAMELLRCLDTEGIIELEEDEDSVA